MDNQEYNGCAGNCAGCASACAPDGEKKINFFDKMEEISMKMNEIGEENILKILNETIAEWEAEDAEETEKTAEAE